MTATSMHSRNYRCGIMLADGKTVDEAQKEMGMVVEGVNTTKERPMNFLQNIMLKCPSPKYFINTCSRI